MRPPSLAIIIGFAFVCLLFTAACDRSPKDTSSSGTPGQTVESGDSGNRNFVGQPTREIEGSVFIVSRPGENKKLALVSLRAFQAEHAKNVFAQIQANVEQAIESISVEAQ